MIYIVLMKELATEVVTPVVAFEYYDAAMEWVERAIDADSDYGFKIDTVQLNPTELAY